MTGKTREEGKMEEFTGASDASRRQFLKKTIIATGFAIPVIQSFSVLELGVSEAKGKMEKSPWKKKKTPVKPKKKTPVKPWK